MPPSLRSLLGLPRKLYRRSQTMGQAREERRFSSGLRSDPAAPALVLSPHWDDAVLDCWSVLSGGGEVTVVNLFAGIPAPGRVTVWDEITGAGDSTERAHERIAEDARALTLASRKPLNLPLLDAQYRPGVAAPSLKELDRAVCAEVASASRVYAPAGIGAHADHVLARRYGRMLLRGGMPVTLYAELPYCIFHGWPPWVDGREPEPNRNVDAYWRSFLGGVPEMPPLSSGEVVRLDAREAAAKLEAMRSYKHSLNLAVRQMLADPAMHGFEVRWELRAPSQGRSG
jgi:hypothetical protein